jgi:hypothetical protein
MATITFRLAEAAKADIEAAAQREGISVGAYIRQTLDLHDQEQIDGLNARVEALWEKVQRLEQIAGL